MKQKFKKGNLVIIKERENRVYEDSFDAGYIAEVLRTPYFSKIDGGYVLDLISCGDTGSQYGQALEPSEVEFLAESV